MHYPSNQIKKQKKSRDDLNSENVTLTGNTEYRFCIKNFKGKVNQGPLVCVKCNRCLYYKNVLLFDIAKYDNEFICKNFNTRSPNLDSKPYISKTRNCSAGKLKIPCQAVLCGLFQKIYQRN